MVGAQAFGRPSSQKIVEYQCVAYWSNAESEWVMLLELACLAVRRLFVRNSQPLGFSTRRYLVCAYPTFAGLGAKPQAISPLRETVANKQKVSCKSCWPSPGEVCESDMPGCRQGKLKPDTLRGSP